jgi:hypothetical protein
LKDENGKLLTHTHNTKLFGRQMHTAEPLEPKSSSVKLEIATERQKRSNHQKEELSRHYDQLHTKSYDILVSRLTPYLGNITGDHQCGFWYNSSTTHQILNKKQKYNGKVHQLFIDFVKADESGEKCHAVFSLNLVYL